MQEFIDKTASTTGTPINRKTMMAMQGFIAKTTTFGNNTILQTNSDGHTLETTFNADGSITEKFKGNKTITKTTTFSGNKITEVIS